MKKRLRLLAWLITLTILCQMLPFSAFAQSDIAQTLVQRRVSASSLDEQNDLSSVTFEGGTGTPEDPYQIATAEQLDAIRNNLGASYVLVNDIDLSNYGNWVPIGWSFDPNPSPGSTFFYGTLDGQNHSISNLTINYDAFVADSSNPCPNRLGLFYEIHDNLGNFGDGCGWVRIGGIVKNLNLDNINFSTTTKPLPRSGGIAGYTLGRVLISNCNVSGSISDSATTGNSSTLGGLCGYIDYFELSDSDDISELSDCTSSVSITVSRTSPQAGEAGDVTCGGIVGSSSYFSNISNCINYGSITVSGLPFFRCVVGGIVGKFLEGSIDKCVNYGTLSVEDSVYYFHYYLTGGCYIGGICGYSDGQCYSNPPADYRFTITNCVNSGNINGSVTSSDSEATSGGVAGICAAPDNAWTGNSTQTYIDNCFNTASKVNFIFNRADVFSYPSYCISTNSEIVRSVYFLDTTRLNGRIPDKSDSLRNGESLSYYEILSRIKEIFPDFELEPAPDIPDLPEEKFSFNKDNLSFLNGGSYFFNDWELYYSQYYNGLTHKVLDYIDRKYADGEGNQYFYQISNEKFNQLIGKGTSYQFKPRVIKFLNNHRFISWGGSCEGMSRIVMLHYLRPDLLPLDLITVTPNSTVYDLNAPKDDNSVENLTNYYFLMQYFPTAENYLAHTVTNYRANPSGSVEEIYQDLRKGNPVFASISGNGGGHAIVLLDIISETSDYYDISVSDPNCPFALSLKLFKNTDGDFPKIEYCNTYTYNGKKVDGYTYDRLQMHILSEDINILDLRNYFGYSNNESQTDYDDAHVILNERLTDMDYYYGEVFVRNKDGVLEYSDNVLEVPNTSSTLDDLPSRTEFIFPSQPGEVFKMTLTPDGDNSVTSDILLDDTLFSISASGAVELTYDEQNRTVDVKSTTNKPIQVNMSFTQNDTSDAWPWNSWAIDTTDTTTFHAELKDDGLHLSGDGIANAKYATEYMGSDGEDDVISKGTIPAGADNVTIVNKNDGDGNTTDIKTPDPVEPAELTVSVSGGTIIQINDDAFAESLTTHIAKQGDKITIMADTTDKFNGWIVNEGDVTLDDATAPTTTFTMNEKSVRITAEYQNSSTDPTPTPTPGGNSSSGSGGGGGGGAAVLIGVGAAAAITAGVFMMSPVEIKGRVVLADQTAVPGAKISLLREGKVVAQTTADENGNFSLKAKRGSYELTAAYTNADGQLIYKTIDIKAPAKDLTMTF